MWGCPFYGQSCCGFLGQMQVSAFTFQTPKLPLKIPLEKAAVSGEIYKKEEFTLYTNLLYQECKSNYKIQNNIP